MRRSFLLTDRRAGSETIASGVLAIRQAGWVNGMLIRNVVSPGTDVNVSDPPWRSTTIR